MTRRGDGKAVWAYRYRVNGSRSKRSQVGGFATRAEAERALQRELARLRPGREVTLAELVDRYLKLHQAAPATIEKLRWLLAKATAAFGEVRLVDLRAEEICAWRGTLPEGHRFEATQALRQVLNRAVAWQLIDVNPARRGVSNPLRRLREKRPFESWEEIGAVAAQLGPVTGPMVVFAAATGLRPAELAALEQRDVDLGGGVVYVRRQLVRGQIKQTKTRRSMRAVPLQAAALEACTACRRSARSRSAGVVRAQVAGAVFDHDRRCVHVAVTQLPSYCTGAAQAGVASTQASRLAPRRHSFVLGRGFGNPIVCGVGGVSSDGEARRGNSASGPT